MRAREASPPVHVGYMLPDKVVARLKACLQDTDRVRYLRLDPSAPRWGPPAPQVVLHKLAHAHAAHEGGKEPPEAARLAKHLAGDGLCVAVDPLESAHILSNRKSICETLCAARAIGALVDQPPFVAARSAEELVARVAETGLAFPIVCKSQVACGTAASHAMAVVEDAAALLAEAHALELPAVAQAFVPHDGAVVKVYVVGSHVRAWRRPSASHEAREAAGAQGLARFDSQAPSGDSPWEAVAPTAVFWVARGAGGEGGVAVSVAMLARAVSEAFHGMELFGMDLLVEQGTGLCKVVDVNSLPHSTPCFPGLGEALAELCAHAAQRRRLSRLLAARWQEAVSCAGEGSATPSGGAA